jgi:regulator of sigma E protease
MAKSPAEISGLKSGDKIISVKSEKDNLVDLSPESLRSFVLSHSGKEIEIDYTRGQNPEIVVTKMTAVSATPTDKPAIGIAMDQIGTVKLGVFPALLEGLKLDWSVTKGTAVGLYTLIAQGIEGKGSFSSVTGPIGLVSTVGDAYKFGFAYLISFAALISVNLAIINIIPFPALDGGRLFFLLIEKIKGSRINPKVANTANMVGFAILIILMLLVTYHDIVKLL